jgi:hypothetical protein
LQFQKDPFGALTKIEEKQKKSQQNIEKQIEYYGHVIEPFNMRQRSKMLCRSLLKIFFGESSKMFLRYYSSRRSRRSNSASFFPFIVGFSSMISGNCLGESMTSGSPPQMMFYAEPLPPFLGCCCSPPTLILPLDLQLLEFFLRWLGIPSRGGGFYVVLRDGLFCADCFSVGERMSGRGSNCLLRLSESEEHGTF